MSSKPYNIAIQWHSPVDPAGRKTVVKVQASTSATAMRVARRPASWKDLNIPPDAIIDSSEVVFHERDVMDENITDDTAVEETTTEETTTEKAPPKTRKPLKLGEFAQVRDGSMLHRIAKAAERGDQTMEDIALVVGVSKSSLSQKMRHQLATLHGVGHQVNEHGHVSLVLPKGKTMDDLVKPKAEPRATRQPSGARMQSKTKEVLEAAQRGEAPPKPIVTSETNKHRQKHIDKLEALAAADDWDAVRAYHMKGIDTYSKIINRYRDNLLTAHKASQPREAAE